MIGLQAILHYSFHFLLPFGVARIFFRGDWVKAGLIMMLTIVIDADHLLANPIFDPHRCSINYHPLHSYLAIGIYFSGLFYKKTRWIATGLVLHMLTDLTDCMMTFSACHDCFVRSSVYKLAVLLGFS